MTETKKIKFNKKIKRKSRHHRNNIKFILKKTKKNINYQVVGLLKIKNKPQLVCRCRVVRLLIRILNLTV